MVEGSGLTHNIYQKERSKTPVSKGLRSLRANLELTICMMKAMWVSWIHCTIRYSSQDWTSRKVWCDPVEDKVPFWYAVNLSLCVQGKFICDSAPCDCRGALCPRHHVCSVS